MTNYVCKKAFIVPECDDDGFQTDKSFIIEEGTVWEDDGTPWMCGGDVRLVNIEDTSWLEITHEHLAQYFDKAESEDKE